LSFHNTIRNKLGEDDHGKPEHWHQNQDGQQTTAESEPPRCQAATGDQIDPANMSCIRLIDSDCTAADRVTFTMSLRSRDRGAIL
jgi:hypothetical protein